MNYKRGFTLIELLVVIAIIGILASIISTSLLSARAKGRDAKRISDIRTLQLALETYYSDNSAYPLKLQSLVPTYLASLPSDPNSSVACTTGGEAGCYVYNSFGLASNGSNCGIFPIVKYHIGAALESNEVTNPSVFLQDADWSPAANPTYVLCGSGGGTVSNFVGKSASGCSATVGSPDSCYDFTN